MPWSANRRLLNAHPWERTELGPLAGWPAEMRTVVDTVLSSAFPIWTIWGEAGLQIYNDGYNEIFGNKHPASFGAPAAQSWAEIWDFLGPALQEVRATREPLLYTRTMLPLARNGRAEECYFDFSYSPIRDARGTVLGVMSVAAERTAEAVRQRRSGVEALSELRDDTCLECVSAAVRAILDANEVDARCAAWLPVDGSAGPAWTLRCGEPFRARVEEMLASQPAGVSSFPLAAARDSDDCASHAHQIPVLSRDGRLLALLGVVPSALVPEASHRDFCEQIFARLHAALRRSEERRVLVTKLRDDFEERDALYRILFDNIRDAAFYCAIDSGEEQSQEVVRAANQQAGRLLGYTPSELIGKHREELFFSGDALLRDAVAVRSGSRHFVGELTMRRKDGTPVPVEVSSTLVPLRTGALRTVSIVRDISERLAREKGRAERARFEALAGLTGGIAHDFNNFLTVIMGSLESLHDVLPAGSAEHALAGDGLLGAEAAAALTQQLLTFAKQQPLRSAPLSVPRLLVAIRGLLASTLGETNELVLRVPAELPECDLDASQLTSALLNLAANARHAMPAGGVATLRAFELRIDSPAAGRDGYVLAPGNYVVVEVQDTGVGIPEELHDRIFEPFFTTRGERSGSGLGLSMVRGFARQSGGDVRVVSAPQAGSRFELLFPVAGKATLAVESEEPRLPEGATVLVVEDNAGARNATCQALQAGGLEVFHAADAESGLRVLRQRPFDFLIANLMLPAGWNGMDLAHAALHIRPQLAIVLTTGGARDDLARRIAQSGWPVLAKPFTARQLACALQASLRGG